MFSKACEYAIKATIFVANQTKNGECVGVKEIAKGIDAPEPYIAKILQQLSKNNFIHSVKGPNGGFSIDKKQIKNKIINIVTFFDPPLITKSCVLGLEHCSSKNPCPMHEEYTLIREKINNMLSQNTIADFDGLIESKLSFLKN